MKYGIELRVGSTWTPARPPTAPPYEFATREEAETIARVLFPKEYREGEAIRITEKEMSP